MANVIKHKRGSGSDPVASDLVIGEVAIRTDVGKLFTKMDNGSVAEIAGGGSDIAINTLSSSSATGGGSATFNGSAYRFTLSAPPSVSAQQLLVSINGVIQKPVAGTGQPSEGFSVDGTDIILGDAPATGSDFFILTFKSLGVSEPADNSVTSAKIVDGAIVNADINASAAIAGTKISPDFGSQAISTTNDSVTIGDSIIHSGDTDTKIRFPTANQISFETQGSEAVRIEENGKVGIGSNNPSELLTVKGDAPIIRIEENQSGGSKRLDLGVTNSGSIGFIGANQSASKLAFQTVGTERMRIDSSGNVGINTTSPSKRLHVKETEDVDILLESGRTSATDNIGALQFKGGSTDAALIQVLVDGSIKFRNTNALHERMRIDDQGRVGIGTTSPTEKLTLGDGDLKFFHSNAANAHRTTFIEFGNLSNRITSEMNYGSDSSSNYTAGLKFTTKNFNGSSFETVDAFNIQANGNVGIGTTSPAALLTLNQTIPELRLTSSNNNFGMGDELGRISLHTSDGSTPGVGEVFRIKTESSSSIGADYTTRLTNRTGLGGGQTEVSLGNGEGSIYFSTNTAGNNASVRMAVKSSGNVGIGTTSPTSTGIQSGVKTLQIDSGDGAELILGNSTSQNVSTNHIGAIAFKNIDTSTSNAPHYAGIRSNCTDTSGNMNLKFYAGSTEFEADTPHMLINSDGNMLVGTTTNTVNSANFGVLLGADGTFRNFRNTDGNNLVFRSGGNQGLLQINGDGDAFNTNNSYGQLSDQTLKQDIVDAASQWNDIKNLRVRKFRFKDNPTGVLQIGVVAQEIEKVSAGLVQEDEEGIKSVKYSVLYMKAVKCLQEAMAKIEVLETKVAALEAK